MQAVVIIALILYLGILFFVGKYTKRWILDSSDYILAGREFGLLANVAELCAIALAGSLMTFLPSLVIQYGIRTALVRYVITLGLGYAVYGLLFGKMVRESGAQTIAEFMEIRFDHRVRTMVSVISAFAMLGIAANNIMSITNVLNRLIGIPPIVLASICFLIILLFSVMGGFWGVTLTDIIQLLVGGSAVLALLLYLFRHYGGWSFLVSNFPSVNLWTTGTNGESMRFFSLRYPSGITMILNFMVFLIWGNNYYFLRLNTCRNGKVARNSYVIAGLFCIPVLLAPACLLGTYAAAIHPEAFWGRHVVDGASALALLIQRSPMFLKIFMMLGFLSITISTASTALIGVTSTVSRDIWMRRFAPDLTKEEELRVQKRIMAVVVLVGLALCFYQGGSITMFGFITSWLGPVTVIMFVSALCPWFTREGAMFGCLSGVGMLLVATTLGVMGRHCILTYVHSGILGASASLIIGSVVSVLTLNKRKRWEAGQRVILSRFDHLVLSMLRYGTMTMAEITDYIGCDSRMTKLAVATLERGGYLRRKGRYLVRYFTLELTSLGQSMLPELPERERQLAAEGLSAEQFAFLVQAQGTAAELQQYIAGQEYGSLRSTAIISVLDHRGYVVQKGLVKRYLKITPKGHEIIRKYAQ